MKKKQDGLSSMVLPLGVMLLVGYLFFSLFQNQTAVNQKKQELLALQAQLEEQNAINQEMTRSLSDGEDAIIERIAREQGYVQPNERVFVGY